MSRGDFRQQQVQRDRPKPETGTKVRHMQRSTLGFTVSRAAGETRRKRREKRELIRRTARVPWPCTQKRACSQEKHWKQEGR